MRFTLGLVLILTLSGCGTTELSLTEYVEQVNAVLDNGIERYSTLTSSPEGRVLVAEGEDLIRFTPQQLEVALQRLAVIQDDALAAIGEIEPPGQVAELHRLFFRRLPIRELAIRAGMASDWYDLSNSVEMITYRAALAADNQTCAEFQETLDATEARGEFADTPWLPNEMKEIVDAAIGCSALPENPEDYFRPPPRADS